MTITPIPGFTTNIRAEDKLAIAVYGDHGSGKTRFAVTVPSPIGFIPLDRKARKTVEKTASEFGKVVYMPDDDFIRVANPTQLAAMKVEDAKVYYRKHVDAIKKAAYKLYEHKAIRTLVIDTGSQLWEDMLFAEFGRSQRIMPRDRGPVNQEMIDLLNSLSGKNLIITHKSREIWKSDKPTGKFELLGFPHIGYHVNSIIELTCDPNKDTGDGKFSLNVHECQDNPEIKGVAGKGLLADDLINFQMLAMSIYPDSDPGEWE